MAKKPTIFAGSRSRPTWDRTQVLAGITDPTDEDKIPQRY